MRKITNEELGRPSAEEFARMEKMPVAVVLDNVGQYYQRTGDYEKAREYLGKALEIRPRPTGRSTRRRSEPS